MKSLTVLVACSLLTSPSLGALTPTAAAMNNEGPAYLAPLAPIHVVAAAEAEVYAAFLTQAWTKVGDSGPLARQTLLLENDFLDAWHPKRHAWEQYLLKRVGGAKVVHRMKPTKPF